MNSELIRSRNEFLFFFCSSEDDYEETKIDDLFLEQFFSVGFYSIGLPWLRNINGIMHHILQLHFNKFMLSIDLLIFKWQVDSTIITVMLSSPCLHSIWTFRMYYIILNTVKPYGDGDDMFNLGHTAYNCQSSLL